MNTKFYCSYLKFFERQNMNDLIQYKTIKKIGLLLLLSFVGNTVVFSVGDLPVYSKREIKIYDGTFTGEGVFSASGKSLALVSWIPDEEDSDAEGTWRVSVYDVATNKCITNLVCYQNVVDIAFHPCDESILVTAHEGGAINVWKFDVKNEIYTNVAQLNGIDDGIKGTCMKWPLISFSMDGSLLTAFTLWFSYQVCVWNVNISTQDEVKLTPLYVINHERSEKDSLAAGSVESSFLNQQRDGLYFLVTASAHKVCIWDMQSGKCVRDFFCDYFEQKDGLIKIANLIEKDGVPFCIFVGYNGDVVWHCLDSGEIMKTDTHFGCTCISSVNCSSGIKQSDNPLILKNDWNKSTRPILITTKGNTIRIWDVRMQAPCAIQNGASWGGIERCFTVENIGEINEGAVSDSGDCVVLSGSSLQVCVYDQFGKYHQKVLSPDGYFQRVIVSLDSQYIVAIGYGNVLLWKIR